MSDSVQTVQTVQTVSDHEEFKEFLRSLVQEYRDIFCEQADALPNQGIPGPRYDVNGGFWNPPPVQGPTIVGILGRISACEREGEKKPLFPERNLDDEFLEHVKEQYQLLPDCTQEIMGGFFGPDIQRPLSDYTWAFDYQLRMIPARVALRQPFAHSQLVKSADFIRKNQDVVLSQSEMFPHIIALLNIQGQYHGPFE